MEAVKEGNLTALLLDMCELALCRLSSTDANDSTALGQGSGLQQLQASLAALQAVLALQLPSSPLTVDMGCDLMLMLTDAAQVRSADSRQMSNAFGPSLQCKLAVILSRQLNPGNNTVQSNVQHTVFTGVRKVSLNSLQQEAVYGCCSNVSQLLVFST